MRRDHGFTLIELIVVLAIAGLALGVAVLALPKVLERARYHDSVAQVRALLAQGRLEAMRLGRPLTLRDDPNARRLWLDTGAAFELPEGVEADWVVAESEDTRRGLAAITFRPDGSNTGGTVTLGVPARRIALRLDWLFGRIDEFPVPEAP